MLKKKNVYVIAVSVFVSFLVILSAFLGLIIYLQWRQLNLASQYYEETVRFDTVAYSKNTVISDLKIWKGANGAPYVGGTIKNTGKRKISSVSLQISFLDQSGNTVYTHITYPLSPFPTPGFFKNIHFMRLSLLKQAYIKGGETVTFKCRVQPFPKAFLKMLRVNSFSAKSGEWCGQIDGKINKLRLEPA
ncbi:MAG: FxLYD domain-containing protein [Candidatus Omnitrophica bacterium]|nr:FxLYD domain-containing protein [Candidatus Omnitrophota bacterium]